MRRVSVIAIVGIAAAAAPGPRRANAQGPREFEVASINPNHSGGDGFTFNSLPGGRFVATNVSLKTLVQIAFGVKEFQIEGGPRWPGADTYDISAKTASPDQFTDESLQQLLQALLADRFQLKFHRELKEFPVYSLVVGKTGSKLILHTGPGDPSGRTFFGSGKASMSATKATTARFAEVLGQAMHRTVINNTGLRGEYDFTLEWVPDEIADSTGPSLFTALQEQLGLKLESTKGPVEVIVIDSAEKASEN